MNRLWISLLIFLGGAASLGSPRPVIRTQSIEQIDAIVRHSVGQPSPITLLWAQGDFDNVDSAMRTHDALLLAAAWNIWFLPNGDHLIGFNKQFKILYMNPLNSGNYQTRANLFYQWFFARVSSQIWKDEFVERLVAAVPDDLKFLEIWINHSFEVGSSKALDDFPSTDATVLRKFKIMNLGLSIVDPKSTCAASLAFLEASKKADD